MSVGFFQYSNTCLFMMSLLLSFCTISIYSLVLISFDRYMVSSLSPLNDFLRLSNFKLQAIIFPLKYLEMKKSVCCEIMFCWTLGSIVGFLPFVWHRDLPFAKCYYNDVITESYQMFRHIFVILFPTFLIFTIYVIIYKIVLHQVWNH